MKSASMISQDQTNCLKMEEKDRGNNLMRSRKILNWAYLKIKAGNLNKKYRFCYREQNRQPVNIQIS